MMPNPFYQIYEGAALLAGAEPWYINTTVETRWLPDFSSVPAEAWQRCQLLYLCSPGNPTGAVIGLDRMRELLGLAERYDFIIAADECYSELYDDETAPPPGLLQAAAALGNTEYKRCIIFQSLSKRSNVPGLRSGFVAGDAKLIARQAQLVNYGGVAMPLPVLAAATRLWQDEAHVAENRARYRKSFEIAQEILGPIFGEVRPQGGFFLWLDVGDGERAAMELWKQAAVKVLPGGYMARAEKDGNNPGARYIRVAVILEPDEMAAALRRMAPVLEGMVHGKSAKAAGAGGR
jgi:N-succinyldiaminopimelate aminotransferase